MSRFNGPAASGTQEESTFFGTEAAWPRGMIPIALLIISTDEKKFGDRCSVRCGAAFRHELLRVYRQGYFPSRIDMQIL